jgi:hypothetical protein
LTTLAFIVPAYRRFDLTRVCLTQLRRTCSELARSGIQATAVVIGDDENLDVAELLGFATVRRENKPLGRKFNDGIEYAASLGCEYLIPFGTDNWIDPELIVGHLPEQGTIRTHRLVSLVHESGDRMTSFEINYPGGDGIRIMPTSLLEPLRFRPADEDRNRAVDTSMRDRLGRIHGGVPPFDYFDIDALQIVGFQSEDQQLNTYASVQEQFNGDEDFDPWGTLATRYPQEAVDEVREVFERRRVKVLT